MMGMPRGFLVERHVDCVLETVVGRIVTPGHIKIISLSLGVPMLNIKSRARRGVSILLHRLHATNWTGSVLSLNGRPPQQSC